MQYQYINGFENYAITKDGDVFSVKSQKYLTPSSDKDGYLQIGLYKDGKPKTCRVHRLVAEAFVDNQNNYEYVDHIDGDRQNNNFKNLRWVTLSENNKNRNNGDTVFVDKLPEKTYSFEKYNDYQFRGYFIDKDDNIYQKITDNRYKLLKINKCTNQIRMYDEDYILVIINNTS